MAAVLLGAVVALIAGISTGKALERHGQKATGLPCPNLPCANLLPRRGLWSHKTGDWAVEECPVCGATVQYVSGISKSAALSESDCYIRVVAPEKPAEAPGEGA